MSTLHKRALQGPLLDIELVKRPGGLVVPATADEPTVDPARTDFPDDAALNEHLRALQRYELAWPPRVRVAGRIFQVLRPKTKYDAERMRRAALKRIRKAEARRQRGAE